MLKPLSVRKPVSETTAVWNLKVKAMILRASFINTRKELTYYSNLVQTSLRGLIKQVRFLNHKNSLLGRRNIGKEEPICPKATATRLLLASRVYLVLVPEEPR